MVSMSYNRNEFDGVGQYGCSECVGRPSDTVVSTAASVRRVSETLAQRLEVVLKARGWTAYEWSQRAGLSDSTVANAISRGSNGARAATLEALAASAGIQFEWLARGRGPSGLELEGQSSLTRDSDGDVDDGAARRESVADSRRLASLSEWPELVTGARARAAERNRSIPEWAWETVSSVALAWSEPPTVAAVYDLVCLFADHGLGRPREMKSGRQMRRAQPAVRTESADVVDESGPSGVRRLATDGRVARSGGDSAVGGHSE